MHYQIQSIRADQSKPVTVDVYVSYTTESRDEYVRRRLPYRMLNGKGNKRVRAKKAKTILVAEWYAIQRLRQYENAACRAQQ